MTSTLVALLAAFIFSGCSSNKEQVSETIFGELGQPFSTLSATKLAQFERGKTLMSKRFDSSTGMGPDFNVTFCASCHEKPVIGGVASRYRDFFIVGQSQNGAFTLLGKNGIQDHYSLDEKSRVATETEVNVFAKRSALPLFGLGLLVEIEEGDILRHADPDDTDGDGISGEANYNAAGLFSRFGIKAQNPDIESFIRGPFLNHAGITTFELTANQRLELKEILGSRSSIASVFKNFFSFPKLLPFAFAQGGIVAGTTGDTDGVADPEVISTDLFDIVAASMMFAAPKPDDPTEETVAGERIFNQARCTGCHVPTLKSKKGLIPLYSDLLVHDMGEALADGVKMGRFADESEFRTQPLWGVAATAPYLHDGRADTIKDAILLHGGEAQNSRDIFSMMPEENQNKLIAFLESLGGKSQRTDGLLLADAVVPDAGTFGGPISELTGSDLEQFKRGRAVFDHDMTVTQGLGPKFNGDACRSCHFDPVIGGSGPMDVNVMRQGIVTSGVFSFPSSGTMAHKHSTTPNARPSVDSLSNVFEHRQTPPLFGLGLIDQIPDATILANVSVPPIVSVPPVAGISGRARLGCGGKVGKFGWKGNVSSLNDFIRDAMSEELGITVPTGFGTCLGNATDSDSVSDPEVSLDSLNDLAFFMANLSPPPRTRTNTAREDAGEVLFSTIGCADCHVPSMNSVRLFSDLLLHDMKSGAFNGIEDGSALDSTRAMMDEFRTPPLWGVSKTGPYMHDGRSNTIREAIEAHDGEAATSKTNFSALSSDDQAKLLEFLNSI